MIRFLLLIGVGAVLATLLFASSCCAQEAAAVKVNYDEHVKTILSQRCSSCHGQSRKESDLDVTNYTSLMLGGGSGEVIAAGSASDSYLYRLITHSESPEMPPSGKIPDAEIELIKTWIDLGALENAGSKPRKKKAKLDTAQPTDPLTPPEKVVVPLRIPVEPVVRPERPSVLSLATSPWANVIAVSTPRQVLLYSSESLALLGILPFEEGSVHQLNFSRDGSFLLGAGGKDGKFGTTVLWDVATGERLASVGDEPDVVLAADISPDHSLIAFGGPSKLVKMASVEDGSVLFEIKKHTDWVTAIEFSPDGKWLATGDRNGAIHVWETATGAELFPLTGHTRSISALSWRLDGKVLASSSEDTTVRTWEMEKGGALKNWGAHGGGVTDLQFLRDGNLATCGRDLVAKIWNQDGGVVRQSPALADVVVAVGYCNGSARLIAADWSGQVVVWNAANEELGRLPANPPTLAERIKEAQEALATVTNRMEPVKAELVTATTKLSALTSEIAERQTQRDQQEAKLKQAKQDMLENEQKLAALTKQQAELDAEQQELTKALPLLEEAYQKIQAAAGALSKDQEIQASKTQFENKIASTKQRMTELESQIPLTTSELANIQTTIGEKTVSVEQQTKQLADLNQMLAEQQIQVTPLENEVAEKTSAFNQLNAELHQAELTVAKWQGESEFVQQLGTLNDQLKNVERSIDDKLSAEEELKAKLRELEAQLKSAREQTDATERAADSIRAQMMKLRGAGEGG